MFRFEREFYDARVTVPEEGPTQPLEAAGAATGG